MFRIIFVLDILNGTTVHAVRGERSKYKPVTGSRVCDSSSPLDIISALAHPRSISQILTGCSIKEIILN